MVLIRTADNKELILWTSDLNEDQEQHCLSLLKSHKIDKDRNSNWPLLAEKYGRYFRNMNDPDVRDKYNREAMNFDFELKLCPLDSKKFQ